MNARPRRTAREPAPGDPVQIVHAKPWKRTITMRGTVAAWDGTLLTVKRTFSGGGSYDSLNLPILRGDWGTIEVPPGYDLGRAKAAYQNGFLRIDVPEQKQSSPKSNSASIHSGAS